jgi:hypothetical protein
MIFWIKIQQKKRQKKIMIKLQITKLKYLRNLIFQRFFLIKLKFIFGLKNFSQ